MLRAFRTPRALTLSFSKRQGLRIYRDAARRVFRAHCVTGSPAFLAARSIALRSVSENRTEKTELASPMGSGGRTIFLLSVIRKVVDLTYFSYYTKSNAKAEHRKTRCDPSMPHRRDQCPCHVPDYGSGQEHD